MDPSNDNPTTTPAQNLEPLSTPETLAPAEPTQTSVESAPVPSEPALSPNIPPTPGMVDAAQTTPPVQVQPPAMPSPVNPVINPTGVSSGEAGVATANPALQSPELAATDPIMMPERPPAPDPIEEELKAPMKAAEPAPGSIGSAISGPTGNVDTAPAVEPIAMGGLSVGQSPQNIPFNDPATQPSNNTMPAKTGGSKNNKTTMIILAAVAGVVVLVLAIILLMQIF